MGQALQVLVETVLQNPCIPHKPTKKQAEFLLADDIEEVMFGGAARGGKSDALLMAALQYVHLPNYRALILRRTYADLALPGALMDRAHEWLAGRPGVKWHGDTHTWTFPSGASLTFGYLASENDKYRYQGTAFHFIAFDELTQFTETQYQYLFSRLDRESLSPIPLRMRSATNPGGVGHKWVKRYIVENETGEERLFIPARLEDNPHVDRVAYDRQLRRLDPVTRRQLRWGDWDVLAAGNMFQADKWKISQDPPDTVLRSVRFWDLAATSQTEKGDPDFTFGTKMDETPPDHDGTRNFFVPSQVGGQWGSAEVEMNLHNTAHIDGPLVEIGIEQEPGAASKLLIANFAKTILKGFIVHAIPSSGSKTMRAAPLSAAVENGHVTLLRAPWNLPMIEEHSVFPNEAFHDDRVDSTSGAHLMHIEPGKEVAVAEPFDVRPN